MQLIHHWRAHLHHPMPMPQQLPQITILGVPHPDPRKAILQHQLQYELRVLPIGLLLAHSLAADLGGISDPQLKPQLLQQTLEPARVSAGFHAHSRRKVSLLQYAVECFGLLTMRQAVLAQFTRVGVDAQAAVLSGSRVTRSPRRCKRFTKYRCSCSL
jgi:hypothetical protein